jgi:hypothetical protein
MRLYQSRRRRRRKEGTMVEQAGCAPPIRTMATACAADRPRTESRYRR